MLFACCTTNTLPIETMKRPVKKQQRKPRDVIIPPKKKAPEAFDAAEQRTARAERRVRVQVAGTEALSSENDEVPVVEEQEQKTPAKPQKQAKTRKANKKAAQKEKKEQQKAKAKAQPVAPVASKAADAESDDELPGDDVEDEPELKINPTFEFDMGSSFSISAAPAPAKSWSFKNLRAKIERERPTFGTTMAEKVLEVKQEKQASHKRKREEDEEEGKPVKGGSLCTGNYGVLNVFCCPLRGA